MNYTHPTELTAEQRKANNLSMFEKFAKAHEVAAERTGDKSHLQSAKNARAKAKRS